MRINSDSQSVNCKVLGTLWLMARLFLLQPNSSHGEMGRAGMRDLHPHCVRKPTQ